MAEKNWVTGMKQRRRWNDPIYDASLKSSCGNSNAFLFQPHFVEDSHLDEHIFQRGWFNQLTIPFGKFDGTTPKRWRKIRGHDKPIHGGWAIYFPGGIAGNRLPFPQKRREIQPTEIFCSTKRLCNQHLGVETGGHLMKRWLLRVTFVGFLEI